MSSRSIRRMGGAFLRMFLSAVVALWCVDVALNLGVMADAVLGLTAQATASDYLGLLISETEVALGLVLAAWILALPLSLVTRRDVESEATALASAALVALQVVLAAHYAWSLHTVATVAIGLTAGVITWILVRSIIADSRGRSGALFFPVLIAGFAHGALDYAAHGEWRLMGASVVAAAVLVALGTVVVWSRTNRVRIAARWAPAAGVLLVVVYSTVHFSNFGAFSPTTAATTPSDRPSIVFIVMDTVRADHLKRFGYGRDTMPALERWAEDATAFTRAVSPGGWTAPSHASMFSGLTVSQHGVHYDGGNHIYFTSAFENVAWLPELLSAEGYYTLAVVANPFALDYGVEGFDRVIESRRDRWYNHTIGGLADYFSPLLNRVDESLCWRLPYLDARRVVDVAMRAAPTDGRPVFLFVNLLDAHAPYDPPPSALEELGVHPGNTFRRYRAHGQLTRLLRATPKEEHADLVALYDAEMRWMDTQLERLLSWVDDTYGSNATVVVTSDHGEELGEAGRVGHEWGLPQRIVHVPLFVKGPNMKAGDVDTIVSLRYLYGYMHRTGLGQEPGAEAIVGDGAYRLVSERYEHHILDSVDPGSGLPYVSTFEKGFKVVGPSEERFAVYDVTSEGFDREIKVTGVPQAEAARRRIDTYWHEYEDERDTGDASLSKELQEKLRSLGYID